MKNISLILIFISFLINITSCKLTDEYINNDQDNNNLSDVVGNTAQLSQFGITWTFDKEYLAGRFANGDYWVIGPVTIIEITPKSEEISGRTKNGSMLNPSPSTGSTQGYDSVMYGSYGPDYDPSLNVALNVSQSNPLTIQPDSSLVSTISNAEPLQIAQLKTAAVLTVLAEQPEASSFRPPYSGTDKIIKFNTDMLDYSKLADLEDIEDTPDLKEVENYFERLWLDHIPGWMSRGAFPSDNMPDYGRDIASMYGVGTLMVNLDFTQEEKEKLLIRLVQIGIDLFGVIENGGQNNWYASGGHGSGRKWPILFAGIMLNNPEMSGIGNNSGLAFGEDQQTFYVDQDAVDITHGSAWDPVCEDSSTTPVPYEESDIDLPEWGIRHARFPEQDHKTYTASYRQCCTANAWVGIILSVHIMGVKNFWNHNALFEYQDRYMNEIVPQASSTSWRRSWSSFAERMWDEYRDDYPPVWP